MKTIYQTLDNEYILRQFVSDLAWEHWGQVAAEEEKHGIVHDDEAAYLQLRYGRQIAKPLIVEHLPLLETELERYKNSFRWLQSIHERLLDPVMNDRMDLGACETIESWFDSLQKKANKRSFGDNEVEAYSRALYGARNLIQNVTHCQYWVVHIPRAVPTKRIEFASVGRAMSQVFYLEQLGKQLENVLQDRNTQWDDFGLARASLYIRIADEVIAGTFSAVL
jgi:hypothetical protein